jgi:hypothetical protein
VIGKFESAEDVTSTSLADMRLACLSLAGVGLAVWPLFAVAGYAVDGWTGILAALLAGGVCWSGAAASLLITGVFRMVSLTVHGVLLGMMVRMGVPLVACVILARRGGALVDAGVPVMILLYYFVMLIAETWWLLLWNRQLANRESASRVS